MRSTVLVKLDIWPPTFGDRKTKSFGKSRRKARVAPDQPSLVKRATASKLNIENNPMQRKEPLEKKGLAGMNVLFAKNILTRRANQGHIFIIAQS
jgi:hypothetical protein